MTNDELTAIKARLSRTGPLGQAIAAAEQDVDALVDEVARAREREQQLAEAHQRDWERIAELEQQIADGNREVCKALDREMALRRQVEDLANDRAAADADAAKLREEVAGLQNDVRQAEAAYERQQELADERSREVKLLRAALTSVVDENNKLRARINASVAALRGI